jgi:ribosomal protein S27AE
MTFQKGNTFGSMHKGRIVSEETRKKISLANKGKKHTEEHKKRISKLAKERGFGKWMKGRKMLPKTKEALVKANTGNKRLVGYKQTEEHKQKVIKSLIGRVVSEETRKKIGEANKRLDNKLRGEFSPNWKGGITPENHKIRCSLEYKLWRKAVFKRDNWTCQDCGEIGGVLNAHHLKRFSKHKELRMSVENGITLCKECHKLRHKKQ